MATIGSLVIALTACGHHSATACSQATRDTEHLGSLLAQADATADVRRNIPPFTPLDPEPLRTAPATLRHDATLGGPGVAQTQRLASDIDQLAMLVFEGVKLRGQVMLIHRVQQDLSALQSICD